MPSQRVFFKNFSGGISNNIPASQIADNQVVEALNVEFDKQNNLRTRPGVSVLNSNRNLLARTEELENAYWTKSNITVFEASTLLANGLPTALDPLNNTPTPEVIADITSLNLGELSKAIAVNNNETYTFSIYLASYNNLIGGHGFYGIGLSFINGATPVDYQIGIDSKFPFDYVVRNGATAPLKVTIEKINKVTLDWTGIGGGAPPGLVTYDNEFWIRVSITGKNNASGNTQVKVSVFPAILGTVLDSVWSVTRTGNIYAWGAQLERGAKSHVYYKNIATAASLTDYLTSTITSIFEYRKEDGTSCIICTAGNKIYRYDSANNKLTDITGGLTLPNGTYWQWVTYRDVAYGVNRGNTAGGAVNPVKITDINVNAVAMGGSPPKALYIELWNNRLWFISADDTSILKCSALGAPEDFTTTGKAGSQSFELGKESTGIKVHQDKLYIFYADSVDILRPGSPNTDLNQYEKVLLTNKIGCISAYSIQPVVGDLVFLSYYGITSLAAVEQYGDFESAVLSQNILELTNFRIAANTSGSAVLAAKSQYFLAVPLGSSANHSKCFIFDFTGLQKKEVAFTMADGLMLGSCFAEVILDNKKVLLIGGYSNPDDEGNTFLYKQDSTIFNDDNEVYIQRITTKAHDLDLMGTNKIFYRTFVDLNALSSILDLLWKYRINEKTEYEKSWPVSINVQNIFGAKYDNPTDLFDVAKFAIKATPLKTIQRRIVGDPGRIGQSIQFVLENSVASTGFIFRGYGFDVRPITSRRLV